jgi:phage terminase large subunit GpA-like protein
VDSGKFPQRVYRWVRTQQQARFANSAILVGEPRTVIAVKGRDVWSQTLLTPQKASAEEKRRGLKVVGVGVSKLKKELYQSLRQVLNEDGSEPPGYRHWPTSYDQAYFRGLTAERLLVKVVHGRPKEVWEEPSGCRNEPMDLDNYNRAAAAACGLDRMTTRDWERIEKKLPLSLLRSTVVRPSQGSDASGGSGSGELGKTPIEPVEPPEPVVARVPAVELPRIAVPTRGLAHNAKWAGRTRLGSGSMY